MIWMLALLLLLVAWLTAAATALRSASRLWLRDWVEQQLTGKVTAIGKDGKSDFELTTGKLGAGAVPPGNIDELEIVALRPGLAATTKGDRDDQEVFEKEYNHLRAGGYAHYQYTGLSRGLAQRFDDLVALPVLRQRVEHFDGPISVQCRHRHNLLGSAGVEQ